jgi:hypothetical protein
LLTSCDASDLLDGLEVSRDFMFEAANEIEQLESRLTQVARERDAMKHDFMIDGCEACKHGHSALDDCNAPWSPCNWEWRGVCEENTKEET